MSKHAVVFDIIDEIDYRPSVEKAPVVAKPKAETPRKAMSDVKNTGRVQCTT